MKGGNLGRTVMALILMATMVLSGCSTNWIVEAQAIVAALVPATTNMVTLVAALQGKSVSANELALVQNAGLEAAADLQLIQALLAAYELGDETSKAGILQEIQNIVAVVQGNFQGLMAGLHIKDPVVQGKVSAVVGILLAEVQSLAAIVPVIQGSKAQAMARVVRPRAPLNAGEFVKSYNSVLRAKSGSVEVDRVTAGLEIR